MQIRPVLETMSPYVPGKLVPGKIKLASNENPLGSSPAALAAIGQVSTSFHLYPDGGAVLLKEALARHYGLSPDMFVVGNGSDEVLVLLAATFLNPGDHVLVGANTFSEYRFASRLFDGQVASVPLRDGAFDTTAFLAAVKPQTRAIFLCSPNNPTGGLIPRQELVSFLERLSPEVLVVLDAAYSEYVDDSAEGPYPGEADLLRRFGNLVILHTFSKIYGLAGLRVGYAMASSTLCSWIERSRQPFNVSIPAQAAARAALDDHDFVARSRAMNSAGKIWLEKEVTRLGLRSLPSQANFLAIETGFDAATLYNLILERGLTIRPCGSFGLPQCIRVTIGTPEQNQRFIEALASSLEVLRRPEA